MSCVKEIVRILQCAYLVPGVQALWVPERQDHPFYTGPQAYAASYVAQHLGMSPSTNCRSSEYRSMISCENREIPAPGLMPCTVRTNCAATSGFARSVIDRTTSTGT